jgi:hypothetical protein
MKSIVLSGSNLFKGNIKSIQAAGEELKLVFDSNAQVVFEKKDYEPESFSAFMNTIKSININTPGIFYINVPRGTVENIHTEKSNKEYDSMGGAFNKNVIPSKSSLPLINGVFTQAAQGASTQMNTEQLDKLTNDFKAAPRKQLS